MGGVGLAGGAGRAVGGAGSAGGGVAAGAGAAATLLNSDCKIAMPIEPRKKSSKKGTTAEPFVTCPTPLQYL